MPKQFTRPHDYVGVLNRALQPTPQASQPGQIVTTILNFVGGLTTAGSGAPNPALSAGWVAVGNGTQAFSVGLTTLAAEQARAPIVRTALLPDGRTICQSLFGPNIARFSWTEFGLFDPSGGGTANAGVLYAYAAILPCHLHTSLKWSYVQWSAT